MQHKTDKLQNQQPNFTQTMYKTLDPELKNITLLRVIPVKIAPLIRTMGDSNSDQMNDA